MALKLQVPFNLLEKDEMTMLFTADGTLMPLYAKITLCIQINQLKIYKDVNIVKCLNHDIVIILGYDFLKLTSAILDYGKRCVTFHDCDLEVLLHATSRDCRSECAAIAILSVCRRTQRR